jgi:hypothetical protein
MQEDEEVCRRFGLAGPGRVRMQLLAHSSRRPLMPSPTRPNVSGRTLLQESRRVSCAVLVGIGDSYIIRCGWLTISNV